MMFNKITVVHNWRETPPGRRAQIVCYINGQNIYFLQCIKKYISCVKSIIHEIDLTHS